MFVDFLGKVLTLFSANLRCFWYMDVVLDELMYRSVFEMSSVSLLVHDIFLLILLLIINILLGIKQAYLDNYHF